MGLLKAINITFMLFINNRNRNDCSILKVNLFRIYQRVAENSFLFFSARSNIVQLIRSLEKKKKKTRVARHCIKCYIRTSEFPFGIKSSQYGAFFFFNKAYMRIAQHISRSVTSGPNYLQHFPPRNIYIHIYTSRRIMFSQYRSFRIRSRLLCIEISTTTTAHVLFKKYDFNKLC